MRGATIVEHREDGFDMAQPASDGGEVVEHALAAPQAHEPVVGQGDARAIPIVRRIGNVGHGVGVYSGI